MKNEGLSLINNTFRRPYSLNLVSLHFVDSVGNGIAFSAAILFLTVKGGFSNTEIGILFLVSGVFSILISPYIGKIADRYNARYSLMILLFISGISQGSIYFSNDKIIIFFLYSISIIFHSACTGPFIALIQKNIDFTSPTTARSYVRSWGNAGMAFGAALSLFFLYVYNDRFLALVPILDGISYVLAAVLLFFVKNAYTKSEYAENHKSRKFISCNLGIFIFLSAILNLPNSFFSVGIPLIINNYNLPLWIAPAVIWGNTLIVTLLQVKFAQYINEDKSVALKFSRVAAFLNLTALLLIFLIKETPIILIFSIFIIFTVSELLQNSSFFFYTFYFGEEKNRSEISAYLHQSMLLEGVTGPSIVAKSISNSGVISIFITVLLFTLPIFLYSNYFTKLEKQING